MKRCLVVVALLSVLSLAACAGIGTSPKGLEAPIEKASIGLVSDVRDGGYQLIDAEGLNKWLVEKKDFILIDSNPKPAYDKAHLKGSVSSTIPRIGKELTPLDGENILKVAGSNKNKTIVVYCGFTACQRSHWGAKILVDRGYKNVYRFPGGIVSWQEYGFPVEGK